jgi:hypothetical protein
MGLFLLTLFWGLAIMHSLAAIGQDYCVFCFTPYIAFFNVAGILLLVVVAGSWNWHPPLLNQAVLIVVLMLIFTGIGYSAVEDIGSPLLQLPAPRMRDLHFLPGFVTWWDILSNRFHISNNLAMKYVSTFFGFSLGGLIILAGYVIWNRMGREKVRFGSFIAVLVLGLGLVLSPVMHGSAGAHDCDSDVILANEQIGAYLQEVIPQGSLVYWNGGLSTAPLLYLPEADIFPAQINDGYAFRSQGNTAELIKFGYWNEEMDAGWKASADYFIIESWRFTAEWKEFLNPEEFDEFKRSPVGTSCLEGSQLRVFHRK